MLDPCVPKSEIALLIIAVVCNDNMALDVLLEVKYETYNTYIASLKPALLPFLCHSPKPLKNEGEHTMHPLANISPRVPNTCSKP